LVGSAHKDIDRMVDAHGDYLFRFAMLRVHNQTVARDLVQDTFLAALKSIDTYRGASVFRTWLTGILKNKIIDHYRKSARNEEITLSDLVDEDDRDFDESGHWRMDRGPMDWGDHPEARLHQAEFLKILKACLDLLPGAVATVFTMREMDGFNSDEIIQELKITASNLWVMLHRARKGLRKCLESEWFGAESK